MEAAEAGFKLKWENSKLRDTGVPPYARTLGDPKQIVKKLIIYFTKNRSISLLPQEEIDKGYFVKKIKEAKDGIGFKIYAYPNNVYFSV